MHYWRTIAAYIGPRQPTFAPPQLSDVLNELEQTGWEIFAVLPSRPSEQEVMVVTRKTSNGGTNDAA